MQKWQRTSSIEVEQCSTCRSIPGRFQIQTAPCGKSQRFKISICHAEIKCLDSLLPTLDRYLGTKVCNQNILQTKTIRLVKVVCKPRFARFAASPAHIGILDDLSHLGFKTSKSAQRSSKMLNMVQSSLLQKCLRGLGPYPACDLPSKR